MVEKIYESNLTGLCYADRAEGQEAEKAFVREYFKEIDRKATRKRNMLKKLVFGIPELPRPV